MTRGSGHERLSPADASNVELDAPDQVNGFLLAGLLGRGGVVGPDGAVDLAGLRTVIGERLETATDAALARFGRRIGRDGRRLVWEPCPPDLSWHVRPVEAVAGRDGLARLCATLMTTPLPMDRPLWELLVVPGAGPDGPGIVLRVHHALVDGVAGARLVPRLFDPAATDAATTGARPGPIPPPEPPRRASLRLGVARVTSMLRATVPPTTLLGPIGPHRGVAFADADLASIARAAKAAGGTVNDALLAAVAAAVATTLRAAGEDVPAVLPTSVPVALPDRGRSGNAAGVMLVRLPLAEPDPARRIAAIAPVTRAGKAEARAQGTFELTRTRAGARLMGMLARRQRFIALFVTDVRGPAQRLSLAGAPLEVAWPVSAIQGNVRLGIAAFSYAGRLGCSAHLDADALDRDVFGDALDAELARIADLVRPA